MTNDERFQIVRFLIALAYVDGKFSSEERSFIKEKLQMMKLTEDQKAIVSQDVYHPKNPLDVFEDVTNPRVRRVCVEAGRLLIYSDKDVHLEEKEILQALESKQGKDLKVADAYKDINQQMMDLKQKSDSERSVSRLTQQIQLLWAYVIFID